MKTDKPPRQTMRTLVRKAIKNRYDTPATIDRNGVVRAGCFHTSHLYDWSTVRTDAGSIRLQLRKTVFFTFGPDA